MIESALPQKPQPTLRRRPSPVSMESNSPPRSRRATRPSTAKDGTGLSGRMRLSPLVQKIGPRGVRWRQKTRWTLTRVPRGLRSAKSRRSPSRISLARTRRMCNVSSGCRKGLIDQPEVFTVRKEPMLLRPIIDFIRRQGDISLPYAVDICCLDNGYLRKCIEAGTFRRRRAREGTMLGLSPLVIFIAVLVFLSIKILNEYERGVVFTLGRYSDTKGPGLVFVIPGIQQMVRVSLRTVVFDVPPQ